jgi:REP element-mobilizing transposase RayT
MAAARTCKADLTPRRLSDAGSVKTKDAVMSPFTPRKAVLSRSESRHIGNTGISSMFGESFDPKGELLIYEHCRPHWSQKERTDFQKRFNRCREEFLDSCRGRCLLKRPELAQIVADSLLHFDGQRYRMGDFIVMPNHVHLLAVFSTAEAMKEQCDSWLHYTAVRINQTIGENGKFWQQEPFDHLVRSPEQYEYLTQYIADNPKKSGLKPGEYHYHRFNG